MRALDAQVDDTEVVVAPDDDRGRANRREDRIAAQVADARQGATRDVNRLGRHDANAIVVMDRARSSCRSPGAFAGATASAEAELLLATWHRRRTYLAT